MGTEGTHRKRRPWSKIDWYFKDRYWSKSVVWCLVCRTVPGRDRRHGRNEVWRKRKRKWDPVVNPDTLEPVP